MKNVEKVDKSLFQIPFAGEISSGDSLKVSTKTTTKTPDQQIKQQAKINITSDIFAEILKLGEQILKQRAIAEEELRADFQNQSLHLFAKKSNLKSADKFYYKKALGRKWISTEAISSELINLESTLGAEIFGKIPEDTRRDFFIIDHNSWIWHEEKTEKHKQIFQQTTRYDIYEDRVIKILPGPKYVELKARELENFYRATLAYRQTILARVYGMRWKNRQNLL